MRIGLFTGGSIPSYYAHSFNVMKMANAFADIGHDVEVVTSNSFKTQLLKRKIRNLSSHYGLSKKLKVTWLSTSFIPFLTNQTSGDPFFCKKASDYAKNKAFDFIFCRSYLIPYYTAKMGIPTFVETHTVNYDHPDLKKIYRIGELDSFRGLVTIHDSIGKEHEKRGIPSKKILVLEDGVDLDRFDIEDDPIYWRKSLHLDPDRKYVVYCGHLYPDKGIEVILESAKILSSYKKLVFLLVGGFESDRKHWEKYCRLNSIKNVVFTGYVDNSQVPAYLKSADCLLLPYKMDMNHEVMDINTTSPLKLFEYMAASRPIIATDIPTIAKILSHGENAFLAETSVADFADKIQNCLEESVEKKKDLGKKAYHDVLEMSWTNRCRKILALY